jgi:hypothetical protein
VVRLIRCAQPRQVNLQKSQPFSDVGVIHSEKAWPSRASDLKKDRPRVKLRQVWPKSKADRFHHRQTIDTEVLLFL